MSDYTPYRKTFKDYAVAVPIFLVSAVPTVPFYFLASINIWKISRDSVV